MDLHFVAPIWFWKGPAPWYFVTVPDDLCSALESASPLVSYGWGMIPVTAGIGRTEWKTSLFPKDGRFIVPLKASVRKAERLEVADEPEVRLTVRV